MKTWSAKPDEVKQNWWLVDASNQTVGRLATQIANVLRGKNKPQYTPHVDTGDFVVVINSENVKFSGTKWLTQKYYRHSRFFGSLKEETAQELRQTNPEKILIEAVQGMLPKNKMARQLIKKLKVFKGPEHNLTAQKPQTLDLKSK
jgi:large subunit ribosomal protein L13